MSGTAYEYGDVVLVPFPFTSNPNEAKRRPAMVVSSSAYNAGTRDIILIGITSNTANTGFHILITQKNMEKGNLVAPSLIKYGNIYTLSKDRIVKKIGKVDRQTISEVARGLRVVLNLPESPLTME
jgi:mRNA interferase MazF